MNRPRLLAYAQLMRLPNVFTAFADICLGACVGGYLAERPVVFVLLLLGSGCLYCGGMVLNDWFDRHDDLISQPFRPIPSGRISPAIAGYLGEGLLLLGILFAGGASKHTNSPDRTSAICVILGLACLISAYNWFAKRTVVGPVVMGSCRFLNVMMGLIGTGQELTSVVNLHVAAVVGVYIVGVTWFARTEETNSKRRNLIGAALIMLAAIGLAITVPVHLPSGTTPVYFPYLVVAFAIYVGSAVVAAIQKPDPKTVQAAVKRSILGLVLLDATLATAFVGAWGLLIGLLLLPARFLGRWVYST